MFMPFVLLAPNTFDFDFLRLIPLTMDVPDNGYSKTHRAF